MNEIAAAEPASQVRSIADRDPHVAGASRQSIWAAAEPMRALLTRGADGAGARFAELLLSEALCRLCRRGEPEVAIALHDRRGPAQDAPAPADLTTLCSDCMGDVGDMLEARSKAITDRAADDRVREGTT